MILDGPATQLEPIDADQRVATLTIHLLHEENRKFRHRVSIHLDTTQQRLNKLIIASPSLRAALQQIEKPV